MQDWRQRQAARATCAALSAANNPLLPVAALRSAGRERETLQLMPLTLPRVNVIQTSGIVLGCAHDAVDALPTLLSDQLPRQIGPLAITYAFLINVEAELKCPGYVKFRRSPNKYMASQLTLEYPSDHAS
ncbi:hypothetical protein [Paraburkholderia kirstenboschensis]|uniref:hypothetical protein n=1 Tax=Paraburkholderia kirstenboschensis TaxID=1245436 RepID=UPI000A6FA252|nr:hypothetical protein [Paraburkholderia kirstenboschensis]